ncbi:MAG: aa3-type cytochrome c oxidase subunit IV [Pseudomonadota bacterium]
MAKHKHGSMKVDAQEKTFEGFVSVVTWTVGICVGILIFLAIFAA